MRNTSQSRPDASVESASRRRCRNPRSWRPREANATPTSRSAPRRASSDRRAACARDARRRWPATPCRAAGCAAASPAPARARRVPWRPCGPRTRSTRGQGAPLRGGRRGRRPQECCTADGDAPSRRRPQATAGGWSSWERVRTCGASRTLARGSVSENTEPFPTSLRTVSSPRIPAANSRLIARPRPVPP